MNYRDSYKKIHELKEEILRILRVQGEAQERVEGMIREITRLAMLQGLLEYENRCSKLREELTLTINVLFKNPFSSY